METELKELKKYACLLEDLCYYAIKERVSLDFLFSILPKNRSTAEKTQNTLSALTFIHNKRASFEDKAQLEMLRSEHKIENLQKKNASN